jgi:hypothetical protein
MSERTPDGDLSRRSLLRGMGGLGATGLVGSLVGCSQVTDRRYEAAPVALEDADEREQRLFDAGTWEVTKRPEALGLDVEATLVNHFAAYRGPERIESRDVEFFGKETTANVRWRAGGGYLRRLRGRAGDPRGRRRVRRPVDEQGRGGPADATPLEPQHRLGAG